MKRYLYALRYLVSIHLLGLLFFAAFRLILFMQGYDYLAGENLSVLTRAEAFARGVWLDNVVACYIMILPLTVVSICALLGYYGKALFRGVGIFFSLFYVLAFAISAADIPYFAYFFKHINASIFNWFGYAGTTLGLMFGEFSYIVAFVLFLALSILFVFLLRWLRQRTCLDIHRVSDEKFHWPNELLMLLGSIVLIGGCMFGIRGRVGYNPIKVSAAYYCNNTFLNQLGVSPAFNLLRSSLEASKSENREIELMDDQEAIARVRREYHIADSLPEVSPIARRVENPGEPTRQNVVLIFMESMSAELMGHFGNPWQLTPFLDTIATKSLCFNRFFSAGTHTNHAIHSTLYSYPALMKRNSMKGAVIPFFAGLPTILQDNGYSTLFFMTHESQYDNMNGYLRTNGFDRIFAQEDYPKEKVVNSFGVQDDFLYQYALPVLTQTAREGKPFFAALCGAQRFQGPQQHRRAAHRRVCRPRSGAVHHPGQPGGVVRQHHLCLCGRPREAGRDTSQRHAPQFQPRAAAHLCPLDHRAAPDRRPGRTDRHSSYAAGAAANRLRQQRFRRRPAAREASGGGLHLRRCRRLRERFALLHL